jgi:hypothetical protein
VAVGGVLFSRGLFREKGYFQPEIYSVVRTVYTQYYFVSIYEVGVSVDVFPREEGGIAKN